MSIGDPIDALAPAVSVEINTYWYHDATITIDTNLKVFMNY